MCAAKVFEEVALPVELFVTSRTGPFVFKIMKVFHVDLAVAFFVEVRWWFAQILVVLLVRAVEYALRRFRR